MGRKTISRTKRSVFLATMCVLNCAMSGCIESSFDLANESRMPRFVSVPPGLTRADVSVTMDYPAFSAPRAKFTSRDKSGKKIGKVTAHCLSGPIPGYAHYDVVTSNGITEVIKLRPYKENENMIQNGHIAALFYVIDDPAVKGEVLAASKKK